VALRHHSSTDEPRREVRALLVVGQLQWGSFCRNLFTPAATLPLTLAHVVGCDERTVALGVSVQVAFERQTLKPVLHLTGSRVETRRLSAMVRGSQRATPHLGRRARRPRQAERRPLGADLILQHRAVRLPDFEPQRLVQARIPLRAQLRQHAFDEGCFITPGCHSIGYMEHTGRHQIERCFECKITYGETCVVCLCEMTNPTKKCQPCLRCAARGGGGECCGGGGCRPRRTPGLRVITPGVRLVT
jgi:hypothetical protein